MEVILLIGTLASGKTSFYRRQFQQTHLRLNRSILETSGKELALLKTCFEIGQSFVIDDTNHTKALRAYYLDLAKSMNCTVTGYYFQTSMEPALARNHMRLPHRRTSERAVLNSYLALELPDLAEGFDALYYTRLNEDMTDFIVAPWDDSASPES